MATTSPNSDLSRLSDAQLESYVGNATFGPILPQLGHWQAEEGPSPWISVDLPSLLQSAVNGPKTLEIVKKSGASIDRYPMEDGDIAWRFTIPKSMSLESQKAIFGLTVASTRVLIRSNGEDVEIYSEALMELPTSTRVLEFALNTHLDYDPAFRLSLFSELECLRLPINKLELTRQYDLFANLPTSLRALEVEAPAIEGAALQLTYLASLETLSLPSTIMMDDAHKVHLPREILFVSLPALHPSKELFQSLPTPTASHPLFLNIYSAYFVHRTLIPELVLGEKVVRDKKRTLIRNRRSELYKLDEDRIARATKQRTKEAKKISKMEEKHDKKVQKQLKEEDKKNKKNSADPALTGPVAPQSAEILQPRPEKAIMGSIVSMEEKRPFPAVPAAESLSAAATPAARACVARELITSERSIDIPLSPKPNSTNYVQPTSHAGQYTKDSMEQIDDFFDPSKEGPACLQSPYFVAFATFNQGSELLYRRGWDSVGAKYKDHTFQTHWDDTPHRWVKARFSQS